MIVESANQFALDLYRQISSKGGNLFFSPASLSVALAMTYAGTAGDTKTEIARTLHFDMPDDEVHLGVKTLQELWTTADGKTGVRLNLANRLWGQHRYEFRPEFLEITRDAYGAELAQLDFAQSEEATEAAAATGSALELTSARIEQPKDARIFRVDHPFVYVVRDSRNDAILFIGRAANPLE